MIGEFVIGEQVISRSDEQAPDLSEFESLLDDPVAERLFLVELYPWQVSTE